MRGKEKEAVAQHPPAGTARTRARAVEQRPPDATSGEHDLIDIRHMQPCSASGHALISRASLQIRMP
jgi:hypothetical protein